jgi:hypothetical protein
MVNIVCNHFIYSSKCKCQQDSKKKVIPSVGCSVYYCPWMIWEMSSFRFWSYRFLYGVLVTTSPNKYSVWGRAYSCWMLNCWCITWPVGVKRLIQKVHSQSNTHRFNRMESSQSVSVLSNDGLRNLVMQKWKSFMHPCSPVSYTPVIIIFFWKIYRKESMYSMLEDKLQNCSHNQIKNIYTMADMKLKWL